MTEYNSYAQYRMIGVPPAAPAVLALQVVPANIRTLRLPFTKYIAITLFGVAMGREYYVTWALEHSTSSVHHQHATANAFIL